MKSNSEGQKMLDSLSYSRKNVYEEADAAKIKKIFDYAEGYKGFLDLAKTEREAAEYIYDMARKSGYRAYELGDPIAVGDKFCMLHHGKSVFAVKLGSADIEKHGLRILAAHIDAPRLDLKQVPLYEDSGMAFLKTHYYGGIKKYQWTAIPLALHGVLVRADGEIVKVSIGEDSRDPVFYINDLLPHLGQKQMSEPLAGAIKGESLNIVVGGLPYDDEDVKDKIKLTVLSMLNEKYGVTEEDFISAELSLVPAFPARDVGLDRALIGAYGHDDRVCAYPAITALLDSADSKTSTVVILADKEEIGSDGVTGMQSAVFADLIDEICSYLGKNSAVVRRNSKCLSADVTACYDPNFSEVYEKRNSAYLSCGAAMSKYTGARGKSSTSDASAELVGFVRALLNGAGVIWQTAELGKVDEGGGGTVAKYIANLNIETLDIGVPVISKHAPYELVSKADLYSTYEVFSAFVK